MCHTLSIMRETVSTKYRQIFGRYCPLLASIVLVMLGNGCFVLKGEVKNLPDGPRDVVKFNSERGNYSRLVTFPEFDLEVGVQNGPIRWEAPFLLNIFPMVETYTNYDFTELRANLFIKPKSSLVTFDPWQVYVVVSNQSGIPPRRWQDYSGLVANTEIACSVSNATMFLLTFHPWNQLQPYRDLPFQLSIEGIAVSGQPVSVPRIEFRPKRTIRAGFMLPY